MGIFFGTDGLRGKVNDELSVNVAYKCGNALAGKHQKAKILIGRDTRLSGSLFSIAFASGAVNAGASVIDVGVCPTAGISFLTKELGFDYGVVISASHNPAEFNGIKILNGEGEKIGSEKEEELERSFLREYVKPNAELGSYSFNTQLVKKYSEFLQNSISHSLEKLTIVLDCANGAAFKIAPAVFRKCGAKVIATFCKPTGLNINENCGAVHAETLRKNVVKYHADMGFAFDGDSDRVIAVDGSGKIVDGDAIIYILACDYLKSGKLTNKCVVGTRHTNSGLEKALERLDVKMIRTNIGDKYVRYAMRENNLLIGGEQSGHIIMADKLGTGDGVLTALCLSEICAKNNSTLAGLCDFKLFDQCNISIKVKDKLRVINSEKLSIETENQEKDLHGKGRIMIHVSGTEPCIRVMVESENGEVSKAVANRLCETIKAVDKEL